ncbi:MAG: hypothetical protein P8X55_07965, partial [Desulfosarcinaceae bacterium]
MNEILHLLKRIYGVQAGELAFERLGALLPRYRRRGSSSRRRFSQQDAILITYADMLRDASIPPAQVLGEFARQHLKEQFSAIHLLPFFPFSSDDGFSVSDYFAVNPEAGTWDEIASLGQDFD